ncbi:3167_t:CDS:2 [Funneliformis mosseae]|uniref:3167_t:CDS:1 n=1 Tax=Funneliformis mosseae TaxID=27381 RepID=A0A9N8YPR9_FUNMO|nr:3167_t:CDS:2 [Funneliformis mosseae]
MGEKVDNVIHRTIQKSSNLSSVWRRGEASKTTTLSANSNNNHMGRSNSTLDGLHNANGFYQGNGASRSETMSFQNANYFGKQNYDDGSDSDGSPNNGKCNGINERRENREIYVRGVNSQWNKNKNNNGKDSGEKIHETMSHVPTSEKQDAEGRNNPLIIVEMIANKLDRKRVAEFLNRHIESRNPTTYKCYLEDVKAYGFDHIILIGDCHTGILFLDCYGRVFEWEDSMGVLWSLGDYLSMAEKESLTRRVIWSVEYDGTVAEFDPMDDLQNELTSDKPATKTTDVHPVAKKKKNSKKKNSKKKHH